MGSGRQHDRWTGRGLLIGLDLFLGVTELAGGLAILAGAITFPREWLQGSPFSTYTVPGLALLLVGMVTLAAAGLAIGRHAWGLPASLAAGLLIMGFEIVEVAVVVRQAGAAAFSWLQPVYFVLGLLLALVAYFGLQAGSRGRWTRQASP